MQRKTKIASVVAALTLVTGGLAIGAPVAGVGGSIYACLSASAGTLTKVSTKAPKCPKGTTLITWNQVGPQGKQGLQGIQGMQGPAGATGAAGQTGLNGLNGQTGQQGPQGLMGPMGLQGSKGETGDQGLMGEKGGQGEKGETGSKGEIGAQGAQGPAGQPGTQGEKGEKGETGSEEDFKFFADTNKGEFPTWRNYYVNFNGVFWRCFSSWDSCDTPGPVRAKDSNILTYYNDEPVTDDSLQNSLVFTTGNCSGIARGYLMSSVREDYFPNAYQGFGKYFVKKKATIKMDDVKSYSIDGLCFQNSQPDWRSGSILYDGQYFDYQFTLVDILEVSYPDIEVISTYTEWR